MPKVTLRLSEDLLARIHSSATKDRRSLNSQVIVLIEHALTAPSMTEGGSGEEG